MEGLKRFDRTKFFDQYRNEFGKLKQEHVGSLNFLLDKFESSSWFSADVRRSAFALGNLYVETFIPKTGSRFAPVTEVGSKVYFNRYDIGTNPRKARELGNLTPGDGFKYRGRGFVQITGRNNYEKFDIADQPEKALEGDIAFDILERGIRYGLFTGKIVGTYLNVSKTDYRGARRVINGQDRAKEIEGYCKTFDNILKVSAAENTASTPAWHIDLSADPFAAIIGEQISATASTGSTIPPAATDTSQNDNELDNSAIKTTDKPPPTDIVPESQTQPAVTNTSVQQKTTEATPGGETITTTTAESVAAPVEVQKESVSIFTKIGAGATALAGVGINAGSLVQSKIESLTIYQIGYLVFALGLVGLAIYWYTKAAKGAQNRTLALIEKASDPNATTVVLKK